MFNFFIIIIVLAVVFRLPLVKGYIGELSIRRRLKFLDKGKYKVINNVIISSGDGKTALNKQVSFLDSKHTKIIRIGHPPLSRDLCGYREVKKILEYDHGNNFEQGIERFVKWYRKKVLKR